MLRHEATTTSSEILSTLWGYTPERLDDIRVVDVHISWLRDKLLEDPGQPELILTVRGTGYAFQRLESLASAKSQLKAATKSSQSPLVLSSS